MSAIPPNSDESAIADAVEEATFWRPFIDDVRDLVEACVATDVDRDEIEAAHADVRAALTRLQKATLDTTLGLAHQPAGPRRPWGNPVIGVRNPMAPPLKVTSTPDGRAESDFHLGPQFEGPAGLVHGGVVSLILDQVLGHAVGATGTPGMTGTLTIRYRRGTPLGDLRVEAWVERREGWKIWANGHILGPDGVTAEAEGLFIVPRVMRERIAAAGEGGDPGAWPVASYFD